MSDAGRKRHIERRKKVSGRTLLYRATPNELTKADSNRLAKLKTDNVVAL
jgi:hypothetical protein